jgi:L-asparaginase
MLGKSMKLIPMERNAEVITAKPTTGRREVLVIYTGGTIGSRPKEIDDRDSPQIVVKWDDLKTSTPELERLGFEIDAHSFSRPLDSCNVGLKEWAQIATVIEENYDNYNGFVILHGTDTMVYTASALSFMLRNLGKPVIITGAQRSAMVDVRNDATQNFVTSLMLANPRRTKIPVIPEVCVYFGGKLLRGNRAVKMDTSGYIAYDSPNLEPLGIIGDRIEINEKLVQPIPDPHKPFHIDTRLNPEVTTIFVYPGIQTAAQVRRQLENPSLRAALVLSYGTGNIPTEPEFLKIFSDARQRPTPVILANVTQCIKGPVELGLYETSAQLLEAGFVAASDITVAAAQCKLMMLLGDPDLTPEEVEVSFQQNIAGEQSTSLYITSYPTVNDTSIKAQIADELPMRFRIPGRPLEGTWDSRRIEKALLRFRRCTVQGSDDFLFISIFVNLAENDRFDENHPNFAGRFRRYVSEGEHLVIFDVTKAVAAFAGPGQRISFTVLLETINSEFRWHSVDLAIYIRERGD